MMKTDCVSILAACSIAASRVLIIDLLGRGREAMEVGFSPSIGLSSRTLS